MTEVVDFTTMRHSKKRHIATCPKCGRTGEVIRYTQPADRGRTIHKGHREFCGFVVTDMCEFDVPKAGMR